LRERIVANIEELERLHATKREPDDHQPRQVSGHSSQDVEGLDGRVDART
jgi:hypothetical protein